MERVLSVLAKLKRVKSFAGNMKVEKHLRLDLDLAQDLDHLPQDLDLYNAQLHWLLKNLQSQQKF
jgi:hypothetical protein